MLTLIEARDRAVSKEELMERVWPRLVVEENNLQVQIAALRKVLGPATIATIPGRGYRFTMPVQEASASSTPPAIAPSTRITPRPPLFGRDDDVAAIRRLFEQHAIVSIVGAGGIGKTRVAQAVADAMHDVFADGVRFVDLAPVTDARLVASEVARALDIHVGSTIGDPVDVVASAVASRQQLLLMDNCEHLSEAVATFLEVLSRHASGVRILVTSQEPLKTSLEHVYRLGSLAVLATALVLKGDVDAARAPFAAATPLMVRYDISHRYADALALLAVHDDRVAAAARLLGYSQAQNRARDETRDTLQTTARERALELLAGVDRADLDRWMGEGTQARDADLHAQALGTPK